MTRLDGLRSRLDRAARGGLAVMLLIGAMAAPALARSASSKGSSEAEDFSWSWRIPPGGTIEIKGVIGGIRATPASGSEVEVRAHKHSRRSDPGSVRIDFLEHEGGVTVCALYPDRRGRIGDCHPGEEGSNSYKNDVAVEFEVRVPPGVRLIARTVNGGIEARDLGGPVEARTVNGSVEISTRDIAEATTVNGSITAALGAASWDDDLAFTTVNGVIALSFPQRLSARFEASTVNGEIESDFPLSVRGKIGRRHLAGTLGDGGPGDLTLSTVNGDIRIARAD